MDMDHPERKPPAGQMRRTLANMPQRSESPEVSDGASVTGQHRQARPARRGRNTGGDAAPGLPTPPMVGAERERTSIGPEALSRQTGWPVGRAVNLSHAPPSSHEDDLDAEWSAHDAEPPAPPSGIVPQTRVIRSIQPRERAGGEIGPRPARDRGMTTARPIGGRGGGVTGEQISTSSSHHTVFIAATPPPACRRGQPSPSSQ